MASIVITADLHGSIDFTKINNSRVKQYNDGEFPCYMIVAGDFGALWSNDPKDRQDAYLKRWYEAKPYDVVVIPGNHENYDRIEALPVEIYHNAKVRRYGRNIVFVERNEVLEIDGKKFYCFGGAESTDKLWRVPNISWWPQEKASYADNAKMAEVLQKVKRVDYIIAHTAPKSIVHKMHRSDRENDSNSAALEYLVANIEFDHFVFGHMHEEFSYGKYRCIYDDLVTVS